MKIAFRQGIVSSYASGLNPLFLAPSSTANFVDLIVSPEPTIVAFAHGASDYLQVFNTDVQPAWGPIVAGTDAFLYWEIDQLTATVSYKITNFPVAASLTAPTSPAFDQHWFDLTTTTMKYWTGSKWLPKIAVFAGMCPSGSISMLQPYGYGSQVGLSTPSDPGFIYLNSLLRPIYTNPGTLEFLTTTKSVRIKTTAGTSGVLATPPNAFVPVRASENIPKFSLVYFSGSDTVGLASSNPALIQLKTPIGIVQEDLSTNEMGSVTQSGEVQYDQWDWSANVGQPVYCDAVGQITTSRPNGILAYRIGFIKNKNTILFQVDAETLPQVIQAGPSDVIIDGVAPLASSSSTNGFGELVWSITIANATPTTAGAATAAQITLLNLHTTQIAQNTSDIAGRALLIHAHTIADVTGLQAALDGKWNIGDFTATDLRYALIGHNHDLVYSPIIHTHTIGDVGGLQNALNLKADLTTNWPISQVVNLQADLDLKMNIGDSIAQSQVTGLAVALAGKSNIGHTHIIADVTGLQAALDGKIDFTNTTVYTPTGDYNPASKLYVDQQTFTIGSIDQHTDVDTTSNPPTSGQVLEWNGANWTPATISSGATTLAQLTDVSLGYPIPNEFLMFNGGAWVDNHVLLNSNVFDVHVTGVTSGQFLSWNGTKWVNVNAPSGGATALSGLSDVVIGSPITAQVLTWSGTKWVNGTLPTPSLSVEQLIDVAIGYANFGDVLQWNGNAWINNQLPQAGATALSGLSDVTLNSLGNGQVLYYTGTNWINNTLSLGSSLTDVALTYPVPNQVLTFNGGQWVNQDNDLAALHDVSVPGVTDGQFLAYNTVASKWVNVNPPVASAPTTLVTTVVDLGV